MNRTLVKSTPELWEIVDGRELIDRLSALFGSRAIEVVEREPSRRLAWRVSGSPEARVELALAERDWGTRVAIRVGQEGGEEFAGAALERLLDELGSDQRRPVAAPEWESGSGDGAAPDQDGDGTAGAAPDSAVGPRPRDLDELSELIVRRACEQIERAVQAAEDRLAQANEELGADHRRARRAAEIFARFEREVGRLQERTRRIVAAAASKEVDRRLERSVEPVLREIEERLTATIRGAVTSAAEKEIERERWG